MSGCPVKSGESCPVEFLSLCAVFCCTQICPVKCPVCHRTLSGSVSGGARPIQVYVRWLSGDCPVDCPADCPVPLVCQTGMPSCRSHLFLRVRTYPTVCKLPQSHRTLRQTHRTVTGHVTGHEGVDYMRFQCEWLVLCTPCAFADCNLRNQCINFSSCNMCTHCSNCSL